MSQIQLVLSVLLLLFFGCQSENKKISNEVTDSPFPVILDTVGVKQHITHRSDEDPGSRHIANYYIYYIGPIKDTIYLSQMVDLYWQEPPPPHGNIMQPSADQMAIKELQKKYYMEWGAGEKMRFKQWEHSRIDIRIDTTVVLAGAYPVMLTGSNTDTMCVGRGRHIRLILEAIDVSGNWQPMQDIYMYKCGVGLGYIILPPNECIITLVSILKGGIKKRYRLSIGNNHSEPFDGFSEY